MNSRLSALLPNKPMTAALAAASLVLLPFAVFAVTSLTNWDSWLVLMGLIAICLVPYAGQAICFALAVFGAYQIGLNHLAQRPANTAQKAPVGATASPDAKPAETTPNDFVTWRRTVAAPAIQDNCLEKVQSRGLVEGKQIEHMARVCACYGAAAINVITEADVVDGGVQATADFNTRLSDEARRICQASK